MENLPYKATQPSPLGAVSNGLNYTINSMTKKDDVVYPDFGKKPSSLAKAADKLDDINDALEQTAADLLAQVRVILAASNTTEAEHNFIEMQLEVA